MRKSILKTTLLALCFGGAAALPSSGQVYLDGPATVDIFEDITGTLVIDLQAAEKFLLEQPDQTVNVSLLEYPSGTGGNPPPSGVADNYGMRITGQLTVEEAGNYVFYLAADDNAEFWLSTDDSPNNIMLVATEPTWNPVRNFSGTDRRPGCAFGTCENVSVPISLSPGQSYYFVGYMKEGTGGDNFAVAAVKEGDAPPTTASFPIFESSVSTDITFTTHPTDRTVLSGDTTTFTAQVSAPGFFQWLKDGAEIAGATGGSYTTPALTLGDDGAEYSVRVTDAGGNAVTSDVAVVTVLDGAPLEYEGYVKWEAWTGLDTTTIPTSTSTPTLDEILSSQPDAVRYLSSFNSAPDWGDDYLARVSGWFTAPETGNYYFFIRSDDNSQLFISTDENLPDPSLAFPDASGICCEAFMETTSGSQATTGIPIPMTAGQRYGIVALLKEDGGGDYVQVAFREESDTTPAASLQPIPGQYLSTEGAPLYIRGSLADWTASENFPTSITVDFGAAPGATVQWQSAPEGSSTFTNIEGATGATLTFTPSLNDDQTQYRAVITAQGEQSVTSTVAVLTVIPDPNAPGVAGLLVSPDRTGLFVTFDEPMLATGLDVAANYTISAGATVTGAQIISEQTVFLTLGAALSANTEYTLTLGDAIRDQATGGGNPVSPNEVTFTTPVAPPAPTDAFVTGLVQYERWEGPNSLAALATEITNGTPPTASKLLGVMEADSFGDSLNNYGVRMYTYFVPPETGEYKFFISTDDNGQLFLSTDSNPANRQQIAAEPMWNGRRNWVGTGNRNATAPENRSATYAATQWPGGNRIALVGGQRYYLELRFAEGGGGDNGDVTFAMFNDADPANGTISTLSGNVVGLYQDLGDAPPIITELPVGQTFDMGDDITLTAGAAGAAPLTYQWYKNKVAIEGATSTTLTITDAGPDDIGDYSFEAVNSLGSANSFLQDNSARLIMRGAFNIEAEDYNFNGGEYLDEASQMPYLGRAYEGLTSVADVDFMNANETTDAGAYAYGRHATTDANVVETKGPNDPADYNRGSFSVTNNYAVGWGSAGDWQNYTRDIPEGRYVIFAAVAEDGLTGTIDHTLSLVDDPTVPDGSAVGVEGGAQGLTPIGRFVTPATGAWSSNDLVPLTDDEGNIVEVELSGITTFRWTMNDASDSDFLLLYCLDCEPVNPTEPEITTTTLADGSITIEWTGGGTLWSAPEVTGPWTTTGDSDGSFTEAATGDAKFYQVQN